MSVEITTEAVPTMVTTTTVTKENGSNNSNNNIIVYNGNSNSENNTALENLFYNQINKSNDTTEIYPTDFPFNKRVCNPPDTAGRTKASISFG